MKNLFKTVIVSGLAAAALAVSASAIKVEYTIQESDAEFGDVMAVGVATENAGNLYAYKATLDIDGTVLTPVDVEYGDVIDAAFITDYPEAGEYCSKPAVYLNARGKEVDFSYAPGSPKLTISGTTYTLDVETYVEPANGIDLTGGKMVSKIYFNLASGKTEADALKAITVNYVAIGMNGASHYYGKDPATDDVEVIGYKPVEVEIKMTGEVGIRSDAAETTGIRFVGSTATAVKDVVKEYGFIAAIESDKAALPSGYVVDLDLVAAGKAAKGIAFSEAEGIDIAYDVDGEDTILTCIVNGMPLTAKAVKTDIAVRAYMVLDDDTVVYSVSTTKDSAYDVAYAVKAAAGSEYTENQDYVDAILALDTTDEVPIDLSPLFE